MKLFLEYLNMKELQDKNIILSIPCNVTGSLFDAIEYYIFSIINDYPVYLVFLITSCLTMDMRSFIEDILITRYNLSDVEIDKIKKNIIYISRTSFTVLLIDIYINKLFIFDLVAALYLKSKLFLKFRKLFYITEITDEQYDITSKYKDIIYVTEMPFCKVTVQYKLKFFFDIYRKFNKFDNCLYVNYPGGKIEEVKDIVTKYSKNILEKDHQTNEKTFQIHKFFDKYLYIKSPYWFDTHPRLFHESMFYGKNIYYENKLNIKDGSWYRYYDLMENGLTDRTLSKEDYLIRELSS